MLELEYPDVILVQLVANGAHPVHQYATRGRLAPS
jgi:hypothetical protein